MDNLEKTLRSNTGRFDEEIPQENHFYRFSDKLDKLHGNNKRNSFNRFFKVAVIALIAFVSAIIANNYVYDNFSGRNDINLTDSYKKEYFELQNYYDTKVEAKYQQVNKLLNEVGVKESQEIKAELKSFDELYMNLRFNLQNEPNDEKVMYSMIRYYKLKLNVLNRIITHIK